MLKQGTRLALRGAIGACGAIVAAITLAFRVLQRGTLWVGRAEVVTVAREANAAPVGLVTANAGLLPSPSPSLPTAPHNLDFEAWNGEGACDGPPE